MNRPTPLRARQAERMRMRQIIFRHLKMLVKPSILAAGITGYWYLFRIFGIHLPKDDEHFLIGAVIPMLSVAYGIMAALILDTVWKEYKTIEDCVRHNNLDRFLEYRDVRIPPLIHLLLATLATAIVGSMMLLPYGHAVTGLFSVFAVSFVLVLYQSVAIELDDPFTGVWYVRVPESWLTKTRKSTAHPRSTVC